ncbi:GNAT family N-acetyltransferase [bacterium]|nr:GNAT family N-acetyltransferase [bacterium]
MKFVPTQFIDKKQRSINVREAVPGDALELVACISDYIKSSDHQVLLPHEFVPTEKEEKAWIETYCQAENSVILLAEHKGKIIGNIDLREGNKTRIRHTAFIGMGLIEPFQNSGIGTFILQELIKWAILRQELELLWLQVFSNHYIAINMYKKHGFETSGVQENFIKLSEGNYLHKVVMSRFV